ncbi:MAG: dephospho-CoA kinase [Gemmatimonadaceae bacterium]
MLLVGLTGNIASGKSTVARLFAEYGATVIDADVLARDAVEPGTRALQKIRERWGYDILAPDGSLDRTALRHEVFADPEELEALNAIVHPEVERMRREAIEAARLRGDRIVVCDIPLLFEKGLAEHFDRLVLVDAPRAMRLERLQRERNLPTAEAMAMIAAQMPAELKRARADIVIDNDGTLEALAARAAEAWNVIDAAADAALPVP